MEPMIDITIGWEKGDKYAEANVPARHRLNNKLQKLHELHPEDFQRFVLNKDGTLYAKFPVNWVRINRPSNNRPELTEEQKAANAERFRKMWEERKARASG